MGVWTGIQMCGPGYGCVDRDTGVWTGIRVCGPGYGCVDRDTGVWTGMACVGGDGLCVGGWFVCVGMVCVGGDGLCGWGWLCGWERLLVRMVTRTRTNIHIDYSNMSVLPL